MSKADVASKLAAVGLYPTVTYGARFADFLRTEKDEYANIIREANIKVDK